MAGAEDAHGHGQSTGPARDLLPPSCEGGGEFRRAGDAGQIHGGARQVSYKWIHQGRCRGGRQDHVVRWRAHRDEGDPSRVVPHERQVRFDVRVRTAFLADAAEDAEQQVVLGLAGEQEGTNLAGELVRVVTAVKLHRLGC
ncbi:MAG: hypothetical protein M3R09_10955 [Actinomycetota bacterium]|nr:hypothetical protein [Actinomycetota bacterium]